MAGPIALAAFNLGAGLPAWVVLAATTAISLDLDVLEPHAIRVLRYTVRWSCVWSDPQEEAMSGGMPKFLAKTLTQAAIEESLSSPLGRACALLRVRDWSERFGGGDGPSLSEAFAQDLQQRERHHIDLDWFGRGGKSFWVGAESAGPAAERILGHGLREAMEVALGLRTHEHVAAYVDDIALRSGVSTEVATKYLLASTRSAHVALGFEILPEQHPLRRDLPIDIYWICEVPEFESYVSWNERQVTLVVVTPPVDGEITSLYTAREVLDEAKATRSAGVVVVQRGQTLPVRSHFPIADEPATALLNEDDYTKFDKR